MKVVFLTLALAGCAAPMELRDVPSVDRPRIDSGIREDSPLIIPFFDVPTFDVPAVEPRDAPDLEPRDAPVFDVPSVDVPTVTDAPTVDMPLVCPVGALNCGRSCCLGFATCAMDGTCGGCMPGANNVCERPDGVFVCINNQSNNSHCGRCNNPCLPQEPFCRAGQCAPR